MRTVSTIQARSDIPTLFELAARIERWPQILPHYRSVEVSATPDGSRLADMSAWRGWIPVRWQALQQIDRDKLVIRFHHTRGLTRGMTVEWSFSTSDRGDTSDLTEVSIVHELDGPGPGVVRPLVEFLIGRIFVEYIAGKTLRRIRQLAERENEAT